MSIQRYEAGDKLNLRLVAPSGQAYWGNSGLHDGNWTVAPGSRDKVNTVENVFIRYGSLQWEPGTWTVEVRLWTLSADGNPETADTGPQSWDIDFSLVVSGIVPTSSTVPGDWNRDRTIDSSDFADFLRDFFAGEGDFDNDGFTASKDLLEFITTLRRGASIESKAAEAIR